MTKDSLQMVEYEIAWLVRLTTAHSPRLGSLDRSEYVMLTEIDENGHVAINELAEALMLNLSTASRQVANPERNNYINRFPDPSNGRISPVEITKEGREILERVQKVRNAFYAEILKEWSKEELVQLEENLSRLNRDFKKYGK
ncbi:MarR family winged helix-turn-helix transcriptional regulator [Peribacillus sp. SCS-155]|uniref:MarR family winged helix-turn-helix transcriptional regulator n=1 Tax=Peribacillus sedimenti TaxID=3115297 RepID=UPI00390597E4